MLKISTTPVRTLSFDLPPEVKLVTSHFSWIEELVPSVETSALELAPEHDTTRGYVKMLLEHDTLEKEGKDEDVDAEEVYNARGPATLGLFALKLNQATLLAYLSESAKAVEIINDTRKHLDTIQVPDHRKMIEYLLDAMDWTIQALEFSGDLTAEHLEQAKALSKRWDELKPDDNKTKAAIAFMKGCLGAALKASDKKVLEYFVRAQKLEPTCCVWYHYSYVEIRRIRKERRKLPGVKLQGPGGEEKRLSELAYKLRPKGDFVSILDYAYVLKESLWYEPKAVWEEKEKDYLKCKELLEEALELATKAVSIGFAFKAKIHLAELLFFGKGSKLDQFKGRRLFLECEKERPKNTHVLHKIGKLYHYGAFGSRKWKNPVLAEDYYKRAIAIEAGNFACIMDHCRLLEEKEEHQKIIKVIDKSLEFSKRDGRKATLYTMKGNALWVLHNRASMDQSEDFEKYRRMACEAWIHVMESFPASESELYKIVQDKTNVVLALENMKLKLEDKAKQKVITALVKGLNEAIQKEKRAKIGMADVHRGHRPGPKPTVIDRSETTLKMNLGKGKSGRK